MPPFWFSAKASTARGKGPSNTPPMTPRPGVHSYFPALFFMAVNGPSRYERGGPLRVAAMRATTKLHIAQIAGLLAVLVSFEALHVWNASGLLYLLVMLCVTAGFYGYALSFQCPKCHARLFPPSRLATPFFPSICPQCGYEHSSKSN